ncbi:MAG: ATP-dependent helicase [Caldilineaceae bacterium SB0668_bin_21]|nr:ATP-dependent helicase [Caldilineaceae bacterium SB0668_bin_21]MYC24139.1 ATP-dependent helicase [Caldilineaceae bacterium SB0662_bin_25]
MENSAASSLRAGFDSDGSILQSNTLFLSGPFGAGKTTAAIERILWLLRQERVRGDQILVLVPQLTLGQPYQEALRSSDVPAGALVQVTTVASLSRSSVALYWPLAARAAGFVEPRREPTFLNLETTQYHMAGLVERAAQQGEFDAIRLQRSRIVSQVLDNLNKAALHGFTLEEAYGRLESTVPPGEKMVARLNVLRTARRISQEFRQLCLEESLVDYSLQMQVFLRVILENEWCRTHLFRRFRHLIIDNAEEETYAAQELVRRWLPHLESALIVVDEDGGYRAFLGADAENAVRLSDHTEKRIRLRGSLVAAPGSSRLIGRINRAVNRQVVEGIGEGGAAGESESPVDSPMVFPEHSYRFYPQMVEWAVDLIEKLVKDDGVEPNEIVVLAPFVSDALRFSLLSRLEEKGIPATSHRPSRALNAEPAVRTLLTLAALAHPIWQRRPPRADVALALENAIAALDPVRASVLAQAAYDVRDAAGAALRDFAGLRGDVQRRVSFASGELYERLRGWLADYRAESEFSPLDRFFARLFGELLSQPGFGFHEQADAARITDRLVRSAQDFRWAIGGQGSQLGMGEESPVAAGSPDAGSSRKVEIGRAYLDLVEGGALGALYVPAWTVEDSAVLIAPAYTFLMRNRAVDVQFWLDIGAEGWWQRIHQPLTHPYVLSRNWPRDRIWGDPEEFRSRQESLRRLSIGLLRRARRRVYLGLSEYGESGMEQRGPLLRLLNRVQVQA